MADGSDLFNNYEADYSAISASISKKIVDCGSTLRGEPKKVAIRAADREIEEAEEILGQMEMELLSLPSATRARLQPRLRNYRSDLDKLKRDLKRVKDYMAQSDRDELFAGGSSGLSDVEAASMDQRTRLLAGTERLGETSRRLEDSHRVALETEQIGASVLTDLRRQREQIQHTNATLHEADSYIDKSSRILKGMGRRMATNRMITATIILVLLGIISLVLYFKFG